MKTEMISNFSVISIDLKSSEVFWPVNDFSKKGEKEQMKIFYALVVCMIAIPAHAKKKFTGNDVSGDYKRVGTVAPINPGSGFTYDIASIKSYTPFPPLSPNGWIPVPENNDPDTWLNPPPEGPHYYTGGMVPRAGYKGDLREIGAKYIPKGDLGTAISQNREARYTVLLWARCVQGDYSRYEVPPTARAVFIFSSDASSNDQTLDIQATASNSPGSVGGSVSIPGIGLSISSPIYVQPGTAWYSFTKKDFPYRESNQLDHAKNDDDFKVYFKLQIKARVDTERADRSYDNNTDTTAQAKWGYYSSSKQNSLSDAFQFKKKPQP